MDKTSKDLKYWLSINKNTQIGAIGFKQLIDTNVPFEVLYHLPKIKLEKLKLPNRLIANLIFCQKNINPEKTVEELTENNISVITLQDDNYPILLKEIYDAPAIIYLKGNIDFNDLMLGIVGSRRPTDYGRHTTYDFSSRLALNGITIVSGLALGIDSIAHQAAIDSKGKTIAVLGCGVDQIYPLSHEKLGHKIIETGGAIISEYPIGTPPLKQHFPARNRIISGLSAGLIITEAAEGSGSLITARAALEQNREVFAIPGPIYNKNSFGPNNLIKMGAHLVSTVQDIFDELGLIAPQESATIRKIVAQSPEEEIIIKILSASPRHIDAIIKESGLEQARASSLLTIMEISGKIKHLGGMTYRLNI